MVDRVLIINPFGIGDVLFTMPVIEKIKIVFPSSYIGYWCNERVGTICKLNPNIDKVWAFSRGDWKKIWGVSKIKGTYKLFDLFKNIKKEKFQVVLDFSLDYRYGLFCKLIGIKKRIGFNYKNRGLFLTDKIDIKGYYSMHMAEYYLSLLRFLDIEVDSHSYSVMRLPLKENLKGRSWMFLKNNCGISENDILIGIAPGGGESWGKDAYLKRWPKENFYKLVQILEKKKRVKIILLGGYDEVDLYKDNLNNSSKIINLIGKVELKDLVGIISNLKVLVTNDNGLLHLGVSLDVPTVSIFGPTDERVYGPFNKFGKHIVLKKNLNCRPCYMNFRFTGCNYNLRCFREINVEEVLSAIEELLMRGGCNGR